MKFKTILGALAVVVMLPMAGHCQPYSRTQPPQYQPIPYGQPYFYYFAPRPEVVRKWDNYNRWLQHDYLLRSPYNPESTLDYMLRTF